MLGLLPLVACQGLGSWELASSVPLVVGSLLNSICIKSQKLLLFLTATLVITVPDIPPQRVAVTIN